MRDALKNKTDIKGETDAIKPSKWCKKKSSLCKYHTSFVSVWELSDQGNCWLSTHLSTWLNFPNYWLSTVMKSSVYDPLLSPQACTAVSRWILSILSLSGLTGNTVTPSTDAAVPSCSTRGGRGVSRPALLVRGALLMASYLLALLVPRFSLLMGLTGSVTGAAMTLILPCLFHLRLQWGRLAARDRLIDACILSLGVICSVSGVICSVKRLVEGL